MSSRRLTDTAHTYFKQEEYKGHTIDVAKEAKRYGDGTVMTILLIKIDNSHFLNIDEELYKKSDAVAYAETVIDDMDVEGMDIQEYADEKEW